MAQVVQYLSETATPLMLADLDMAGLLNGLSSPSLTFLGMMPGSEKDVIRYIAREVKNSQAITTGMAGENHDHIQGPTSKEENWKSPQFPPQPSNTKNATSATTVSEKLSMNTPLEGPLKR